MLAASKRDGHVTADDMETLRARLDRQSRLDRAAQQ